MSFLGSNTVRQFHGRYIFSRFTVSASIITLFVTMAVNAFVAGSADARDPATVTQLGKVAQSDNVARPRNVTQSRAERLFARHVLPLLQSKCFACHGDDTHDVRGQFNMLTRAGLLRGGESQEASIVPGKPESSPLYRAVRWEDLEMPPKKNDRLTAEQVAYIRDWILGGAPWPTQSRLARLQAKSSEHWSSSDGVTVSTSGGLSAEWTTRRYEPENLWAYRPLWKDDSGSLNSEGRNPIDLLIEARLDELELVAAPAADRRTLIRRATFDLIGLPPTPDDITRFVEDPDPDEIAFEKVMDRLLDSPHYGEQWARHWLDVARYADSSGYANDYERGNAWRYRDYVVRAFNDDKPYDQFIREQIAGDEIRAVIKAARPGNANDDVQWTSLLVAAGFLRMGPWELTGMEVPKVARQRFLDDVTNAVGQVFLGHMLRCARCHDHKFDPIPTRDYYSIQAAFATTQLAERRAEFLPNENTTGFEEKKYLQRRLDFYQETLRQLNKKRNVAAARAWYADNQTDPADFERAVDQLQRKSGKPTENISVQDVRKLLAKWKVDPATIPPRHVGFEPRDFGLERIARKGIERLRWRMERYEPIALSVYSGRTPPLKSVYAPLRIPKDPHGTGELERTCILAGGDPFSPTQRVAPGVLSAVQSIMAARDIQQNPKDVQGERPEKTIDRVHAPLPESIDGRRLALANWIASNDNPLTARVMVNRIWQWHFGQAIAGNPNNFGATGKRPTHPKLLDWLAKQFMDSDWSIKAMHRQIMMSEAYRRSSKHPQWATLAKHDPNGTSYAAFQPRRLEAEELHDAMLFVSGELNLEVGGIPVRPEMNLEAALQPRQVMGTFAEAWQPSPLPEQRHRRSLYALRIRGQRDPFLEVFNAPSSDLSCEAREATTITPQVFALFNSERTFDRALALASRLAGEFRKQHSAKPSGAYYLRPGVIDRLCQLVFGRAAKPDEIGDCLGHWEKMTARHRELTFDPPSYPEKVVRDAIEENTGEKFSFVEPLEFYANFVPDLKPAAAEPELRGLAEVCLVLLNSNEFAYIY